MSPDNADDFEGLVTHHHHQIVCLTGSSLGKYLAGQQFADHDNLRALLHFLFGEIATTQQGMRSARKYCVFTRRKSSSND